MIYDTNNAFGTWVDANPIARGVFYCLMVGFFVLMLWVEAGTGHYVAALGIILIGAGVPLTRWVRLPLLGVGLWLIGFGLQDYTPPPEQSFSPRSFDLGILPNICLLSTGGICLIWGLYVLIRDTRRREKDKENS